MTTEQFKSIRIKQKASAASSDYFVKVGWQPDAVILINYTTGAIMAAFRQEANDGGKVVGTDGTFAALGIDGITFDEDGVILGQDSNIKSNSAVLQLLAFRNLSGVYDLEIDDAKARTESYGTGAQYDVTIDADGQITDSPSDLGEVGVSIDD